MATVSGIKINSSADFGCGIFGTSESIETIKQKVVKSGTSLVQVDDDIYNIHERANVTATVLSNVNKFIQVITDSKCIVMSTTDNITWKIGEYRSYTEGYSGVIGPGNTNIPGLTWARYGSVVEVSGKIGQNYSVQPVSGLPTPFQQNIVFESESQIYSSAYHGYGALYCIQNSGFTLYVNKGSQPEDYVIISGTYLTSD